MMSPPSFPSLASNTRCIQALDICMSSCITKHPANTHVPAVPCSGSCLSQTVETMHGAVWYTDKAREAGSTAGHKQGHTNRGTPSNHQHGAGRAMTQPQLQLQPQPGSALSASLAAYEGYSQLHPVTAML